jgi:hypothetical protein
MHMRLLLTAPDTPAWKVVPAWGALGRHALAERPLWAAIVVGLLALIVAYQSPRSLLVDIGGALESVHLEGFYDRESSADATFRWSGGRSAMQFAGLGKPFAPVHIHLQLSGGPRPRPGTAVLSVEANGHPLPPLTLSPQSQPYTLTIPPEWIGPSGDLRLDFSVPTFNAPGDRRDLGFMADFVRISLPIGATVPSLTTALWLVLCSVLAYLILRGAWLAPVPSALVVGVCLLACAGIVAVHRLLVTLFADRLALALTLALLAGIVAEVLVRAVVGAAGWKGERVVPEWAWAGLRGLVMASAALKVGGLLHPLSFIIDAPFHLRYIQYMADGRYEYFGEALAFAVMPREEWGSARAFIPYSPFFYVVAAPLALLPVPLALSVPTISALFESFKIALVFVIGLALGRPGAHARVGVPGAANARQALASAAFYALIPATFLLQQWGNWPTQASLWLLTLWVAFTCLFWSSITRPWVWALSTVMLTLTMLSYTVTAAYTGVFGAIVVIGGWLFAPAHRRRWGAVALCLLASVALAMLIYYGQYVSKIIQETLPTFGQAIEEQGKLTTLRPSVWSFLSDHLSRAMQSYQLTLVYALGLSGALWAFFSPGLRSGPRPAVGTARPSYAWQKVWLAAWLAVFLLVTAADFWMDQALKEFWYALPAVAVAGGMWVVAMWGRRSQSRLFVWLLAVTFAWQALWLWVFRLFFHNR